MVYISDRTVMTFEQEKRTEKKKKSRPHLPLHYETLQLPVARSRTRQRSSHVFILPVYSIYFFGFDSLTLVYSQLMASLKKLKRKKKSLLISTPLYVAALWNFLNAETRLRDHDGFMVNVRKGEGKVPIENDQRPTKRRGDFLYGSYSTLARDECYSWKTLGCSPASFYP